MRNLVITIFCVLKYLYNITVSNTLLYRNRALLKVKQKMKITKNISKDVITNHHANWKEEPVKISEKRSILSLIKI